MKEIKLERTVTDIIRFNGEFCDETCPQLFDEGDDPRCAGYYCQYFGANKYSQSLKYNRPTGEPFGKSFWCYRCQKCCDKFPEDS